MDLSPYVDALRADLEAAAAAGTEDTQATARLLSGALDASLRLCLVDALSAMAAEVTAASDVEVEIRMHGREPQLVVSSAPAEAAADPIEPDDDRTTARLTVRLPESLKERAEGQAARDGLSVNAWMVRAVNAAVRPLDGQPHGRGPRRTTGFARS
jgi:predicted HicB family RNase H-like nuclease